MRPRAEESELIEQQNALLPPQQQQQKNKPWVETRARAGNFGAPVFFEEEREDTSSFAEAAVSAKATADTSTDEGHDTAENRFEHESIFTETAKAEQSITKPEEKASELEQNITNTEQDSSEKETPPAEQSLNILNKSLETNNVVLDTTSQPAFAKSSAGTSANTSSVVIAKKNQFNPSPMPAFSKASAKENAQKPPITLAQLTQGFLHQRKELSGSYGISMMGINRGIPSDEQMKYERYLQKLLWCLQNSLQINRRQQPPFASNGPVHVFFSLNRDGILQQLSIKKSSGNMYVDQFVLFIFRDASSSFPPVPSYLTDDPFSMTCIVS